MYIAKPMLVNAMFSPMMLLLASEPGCSVPAQRSAVARIAMSGPPGADQSIGERVLCSAT